MQHVLADKHIDLPLRQFRRPTKKSGDEVLICHAAVLKVLRRRKVIARPMELQAKRSGDGLRVTGSLCFFHEDVNGRVERRVLAVRSFYRLEQVPLDGFFHEEGEAIVQEPTTHGIADSKRLCCLHLKAVGKCHLSKRDGKRADAVSAEVVGDL